MRAGYDDGYTFDVKTAISVPDDVYEDAERARERLGISRSELYTRALRDWLGLRRDAEVTASYDEAFEDDVDEDAVLRREASRRALLAVEWDD